MIRGCYLKLFKRDFKYVTKHTEHFQLKYLRPKMSVKWMWLSLATNGLLIIKWGFPTDGPSGPTFDTPPTIKGATVHDALCQLAAQGLLGEVTEKLRDQINAEADAVWDASGMSQWRTEIWEAMLDRFGDFAMSPENRWAVIEVP